jgi:hypothetical protein
VGLGRQIVSRSQLDGAQCLDRCIADCECRRALQQKGRPYSREVRTFLHSALISSCGQFSNTPFQSNSPARLAPLTVHVQCTGFEYKYPCTAKYSYSYCLHVRTRFTATGGRNGPITTTGFSVTSSSPPTPNRIATIYVLRSLHSYSQLHLTQGYVHPQTPNHQTTTPSSSCPPHKLPLPLPPATPSLLRLLPITLIPMSRRLLRVSRVSRGDQ